MKHRLRGPHHRKMIFTLFWLKVLLLYLGDMSHARSLIDLLEQLLHSPFVTLDLTLDL